MSQMVRAHRCPKEQRDRPQSRKGNEMIINPFDRAKLEKKGYNAIIDDNDKRSFVQSQAPLIVFNIMDNLGNTKVSELTNGEIRRNMIDWQNMKHSEEIQNVFI